MEQLLQQSLLVILLMMELWEKKSSQISDKFNKLQELHNNALERIEHSELIRNVDESDLQKHELFVKSLNKEQKQNLKSRI